MIRMILCLCVNYLLTRSNITHDFAGCTSSCIQPEERDFFCQQTQVENNRWPSIVDIRKVTNVLFSLFKILPHFTDFYASIMVISFSWSRIWYIRTSIFWQIIIVCVRLTFILFYKYKHSLIILKLCRSVVVESHNGRYR